MIVDWPSATLSDWLMSLNSGAGVAGQHRRRLGAMADASTFGVASMHANCVVGHLLLNLDKIGHPICQLRDSVNNHSKHDSKLFKTIKQIIEHHERTLEIH